MDKDFFMRDAEEVARELLGNVLVRKIGSRFLRARIVETEAYYDERDPASRACQNGDLRETMLMEAGTVLVYGVHNQWLMNFVTNEKGKAEAVLLRAVEPLNFRGKCSGPGLLTRALQVDKSFHKKSILGNGELRLEECKGERNSEIGRSNRIGVSKDLKKKLRFYIKENKHVSRK